MEGLLDFFEVLFIRLSTCLEVIHPERELSRSQIGNGTMYPEHSLWDFLSHVFFVPCRCVPERRVLTPDVVVAGVWV
jgi:hypothetical protein